MFHTTVAARGTPAARGHSCGAWGWTTRSTRRCSPSLAPRPRRGPGSAAVAAARYFVHHLDPRSTRVALITFAGEPPDQGGGMIVFGRRSSPPAVT